MRVGKPVRVQIVFAFCLVSLIAMHSSANAYAIRFCRITPNLPDNPIAVIVAFRQKVDGDYIVAGKSKRPWITKTLLIKINEHCSTLHLHNLPLKLVDIDKFYANSILYAPAPGVSDRNYRLEMVGLSGRANIIVGDGIHLDTFSSRKFIFYKNDMSEGSVVRCFANARHAPFLESVSLFYSNQSNCDGAFAVDEDTRPNNRKYCNRDLRCEKIHLKLFDVDTYHSPVSEAAVTAFNNSKYLSGAEIREIQAMDARLIPEFTWHAQKDRAGFWITDSAIPLYR